MAAKFAVGARVRLVPPRAYISYEEAWQLIPAYPGDNPSPVLRADVIGDGTADALGLVEIRTVDPEGAHDGPDIHGQVLTVGPDPVAPRERRYEIGMKLVESMVPVIVDPDRAVGDPRRVAYERVETWDSLWTDEGQLRAVR